MHAQYRPVLQFNDIHGHVYWVNHLSILGGSEEYKRWPARLAFSSSVLSHMFMHAAYVTFDPELHVLYNHKSRF